MRSKKKSFGTGLKIPVGKTAALSAFWRATGSIITRGPHIGFEIVTEDENVAEYFVGL